MRLLGKALTFDDVLLVPSYSSVLPRDTDLATSLSRNIRLNLPLVSAAMDTVTEARLAIALAQEGGIGIVHKNPTPKQQAAEVARAARDAHGKLRVGAAIGVGEGTEERAELLVRAGVDVLVVDTAHGHSAGVTERVRWVKRNFPTVDVIGGNIATGQAALDLVAVGAD